MTIREIHNVLTTLTHDKRYLDQLAQAFEPARLTICSPGDDEGIRLALENADVAVLHGDLDDRYLTAPKLRWVHCDHAGLNRSAREDVFDRGIILTGSAGRSGPALAQHAFYFALGLFYDARALFEAQSAHRWRGAPHLTDKSALWGQTLGIVGFGHTGREMARLGRAFGMRVVVYRRSAGGSSPDVDVMLSAESGDELAEVLKQADVVMLAASLTDGSHHMFSAAEFELMKPDAVIINMARGGLICERALVDALTRNVIAGAGLDTFETEPLPDDSPLWDLRNVMITPHATPQMPDRTQRSIDIILDNIARYRAGESMLNEVTKRDLYSIER